MTTGTERLGDSLKTYLKTKSYNHFLDVLRQLGPNSQISLLSSDLS